MILVIFAFCWLAAVARAQLTAKDRTYVTNQVNALRALHRAPPVAYDLALESGAQTWANTLATSGQFYHSGTAYGENLAQVWSGTNVTRSIDVSVNAWYGEGANFVYGVPQNKAALHFTALVWANTKQIGLGVSKGSKGTIVCMRFNPPGNMAGAYALNVLPLTNSSRSPSPKPPPPKPPLPTCKCNCAC